MRAYSVVCLKVVYLFSKNKHPEIFAEKFDYVKCVCEAWPIPGESMGNTTVVS